MLNLHRKIRNWHKLKINLKSLKKYSSPQLRNLNNDPIAFSRLYRKVSVRVRLQSSQMQIKVEENLGIPYAMSPKD